MSTINDELRSRFMRNDLPADEMAAVEKELIASGQADAALQELEWEYVEDEDEVNALIGEDKEKIEREKKFDELCGNSSLLVSVVMNTKTNTDMESKKLTQEEMTLVKNRFNGIDSNYDPKQSLTDNLVDAYMKAHPEATGADAATVVGRLIDGCEMLTRKYNEAIANNGFDAEGEISAMCEGRTVEERFTFLSNSLAMVEALNLGTFESQDDLKEALKKQVADIAAANPTPTEKDCDNLRQLLSEALANNTLLLSGTDKARELFEAANEGQASVIDFASEQYDDARIKAEMALAMWLEYEAGNITSIESGATPESIGIGAAMSVEEGKILNDVAKGSKTTDMAVKCLKILGGVALACMLFYVSMLGIAFVAGWASIGLMALFGTSTLGIIATVALMLPLIFGLSNTCIECGYYIFEKAGVVYDKVVEKLRESIFPRVVELGKKLISWIKRKLGIEPTTTENVVVYA